MWPLLADVGLAFLFLPLSAMIFLLLPVVIIEGLVVNRYLRIGFLRSVDGVLRANIVSMLFGLLLGFTIGVSMFTANAHFKGLYRVTSMVQEYGADPMLGIAIFPWVASQAQWDKLFWTAPIIAAALLIPSFFISVWIERMICMRYWFSEPPTVVSSVSEAVRKANIASYLFLFGITLCYEVYILVARG